MKKTALFVIVVIIMCVSMAFPVNAATLRSDEIYALVNSHKPPQGSSIETAFFYDTSQSPYRILCIDKSTSGVFVTHIYPDGTEALLLSPEDAPSGVNAFAYSDFVYIEYEGEWGLNFCEYPGHYLSNVSSNSFVQLRCPPSDVYKLLPSNGLNFDSLNSILSYARSVAAGYTGDSYPASALKELQDKIVAAETLIGSEGCTQSQIDTLCNELNAELSNLFYSALQQLISTAKAIKSDTYTQTSWNTLQSCINSAQTLLDSHDYTPTMLKNAQTSLQSALDNLILLTDGNGKDNPGTTPSNISSEMLEPVLEGVKGNIGVIVPVAIGLMIVVMGISFIPLLLKKYRKG